MIAIMWWHDKSPTCDQWSCLTFDGVLCRVWKRANDSFWRYGVSKRTTMIVELGNRKCKDEVSQ